MPPQQRDLFDLNLSDTTSSLRHALNRVSTQTLPIIETAIQQIEPLVVRLHQNSSHLDNSVIRFNEQVLPSLEEMTQWATISFKVLTVFLILASLWMAMLLIRHILKSS